MTTERESDGTENTQEEAFTEYIQVVQSEDYKHLLENSNAAKEILQVMLELRKKLQEGEINAESYDYQLVLAMMTREGRDHLATEVLNKKYFAESLDRALERYKRYGSKFALLILDLDNFKQVNDLLGHLPGDDTIAKMGADIAASIRKGDTAGRFGGDEFTILIEMPPDGSPTMPIVAAQKLRRSLPLSVPSEIAKRGIPISASIGIAIVDSQDTAETIFNRADAALYEAKTAGKNRVCLTPTPTQQFTLVNYSQKAVENAFIGSLQAPPKTRSG